MDGSPTVVFRVDASPYIGGGHVIRCLALAYKMKKNGWRVLFATTEVTKCMLGSSFGLEAYDIIILAEGEELDPVALTSRNEKGCDLCVIDHYEIDYTYAAALRPWAKKILVIDDLANRTYDCDLLLDQTFGREKQDYISLVPSNCKLLLGAKYALLKPEFFNLRISSLRRREGLDKIQTILVTMGLSDTTLATEFALIGIGQSVVDLSVDVVIGSQSINLEKIKSIVKNYPKNLKLHVDSNDMANLMVMADLAIAASGSTSWERACLGLPTLSVVLAENQKSIDNALTEYGAAHSLGDISDMEPGIVTLAIESLSNQMNILKNQSELSSALCDGLGVNRVALNISPIQTKTGLNVWLRPVVEEDKKRIFEWQNIPDVRKFSRNPNAPLWDTHSDWFNSKKFDPSCTFEIIVVEGEPAGFLRFDRLSTDNLAYEISILILPEYQNLGVGKAALFAGRQLIVEGFFVAEVHDENIASKNLFLKAGYCFDSGQYINTPNAT